LTGKGRGSSHYNYYATPLILAACTISAIVKCSFLVTMADCSFYSQSEYLAGYLFLVTGAITTWYYDIIPYSQQPEYESSHLPALSARAFFNFFNSSCESLFVAIIFRCSSAFFKLKCVSPSSLGIYRFPLFPTPFNRDSTACGACLSF